MSPAPVHELRGNILELAEAGAESFLVGNLPSRSGEFLVPNAEEFNRLFALELSTLRTELPATTIFEFDYFSFFQGIEDDPASLGLATLTARHALIVVLD